MISIDRFYQAYNTFRPRPNSEQRDAIEAGPGEPLFIVAGPGTGKTTCLSLRILKLILVDDVPPQGILATTFTVKAAAELRSRILGWGFRLLETLQADSEIPPEIQAQLANVDINQITTGTIDSICEQVLRQYREPGDQPPVLVDDFVSKTLLLREGLFGGGRYRDDDLDNFLLQIRGGGKWGWNIGAKNNILQEIWQRRFQDQVNWPTFVADAQPAQQNAIQLVDAALNDYHAGLQERGMLDFALLEQEMLNRLWVHQLGEFLEQLQVILVDEYQDTNLLQESIYFEMAQACHGALNVVGDDDQSLYRFRGATVSLFRDFAQRYQRTFEREIEPIFLNINYRSTHAIVDFVNDYARLDDGYQAVRVAEKPKLLYGPSAETGVPILGMFRDNVETLSRDLSDFIHQVFRGEGYTLPNGAIVQSNPAGGDLGDCSLLCSSPREFNSSGKPRLPLLLRQDLEHEGIEVFNPRGQDLTGIPIVARFGGFLLECLDPGGVIEDQTSGVSTSIQNMFHAWRDQAIGFAESEDAPEGLLNFAIGWAERDPQRQGWTWPRSVPILDLIYGLVHFFPELHDDPEGQIYLEVFTRQVSSCEQVGKFSGRVVTDPNNQGLSDASVKELLRDFLGPIAAGTIKVNEDLMETFPRDRLSILSIHQSKGLEFPLMIVDVGSDFKTNHPAHRFKRFPVNGGRSHTLEELLRPHTDLGAPQRTAVDRAFDDLFRQFFVAYSRPQEVLLLVGLRRTMPGGNILNVATGWDRSECCHWDGAVPFIEI
ncbi:MAG: ATP-dependent helicase [Chloroflexi bacterium]|nr:ATP-dependent helicase [Chloroflexota bacterium]